MVTGGLRTDMASSGAMHQRSKRENQRATAALINGHSRRGRNGGSGWV